MNKINEIQSVLSRLQSYIEDGHGAITIEIFADLTYRLNLGMYGTNRVASKYQNEDWYIDVALVNRVNPSWLPDIIGIVENLKKEKFTLVLE
jgi:hypothetical protein